MTILFIDCCIRGAESRTLALCNAFLEEVRRRHPEAEVRRISLGDEGDRRHGPGADGAP